MSAELERSPETEAVNKLLINGDLDSSAQTEPAHTLADLPLGARLILRCRKDWRTATVAAVALDVITLTVCSPSGHTYRVRRPPDALINFDGAIPLLGEPTAASWRVALARYDARW